MGTRAALGEQIPMEVLKEQQSEFREGISGAQLPGVNPPDQ